MKIALAYPARTRWPKFDWVRSACQALGHETVHVQNVAELVAADRQCELVLFEHQEAGLGVVNLREAARHKQAIWCQWWFDLLAIEANRPLDQQPSLHGCGSYLPIMQAMDLVCVKERSLLGEFAQLGVHAQWLDQGCPDDIQPCEHRQNPDFDVLVLGSFSTRYRQRRHDARALAAAGFRVAWCGHGGGMPPPVEVTGLHYVPYQELPAMLSRAAIVLDVCARHDLEGYWSDRIWLALGMGACVLRRFTPGQPAFECRSYDSHEMLLAQARELCAQPDLRSTLGSRARQQTLAHHTYTHRVKELLCRLQPLVDRRASTVAARALSA